MKGPLQTGNRGSAIWQRIIQFQEPLAPSAARALLNLGFSSKDHALMQELSAKAQTGTLTPEEQADLDTYERLGCLLDIVHSEARQALMNGPGQSRVRKAQKKSRGRAHSHG